MTQTARLIAEVWSRGESITPAQAYERYGCLALHSRAAEARSQGVNVQCTIRTNNGHRWGEYAVPNDPIQAGIERART